MKRTALLKLTTLALALSCAFVFTGCKKKPDYITNIPGKTGGTRIGEPTSGDKLGGGPGGNSENLSSDPLKPTTQGNPPGPGHPGYIQDREFFKAEMLFFAFDSSVIRDGEKPKLQKVADYLKSNGDKAVLVEGHCDERGTEEYNRSLGDRRALAVREELVKLGITADRVDTISFGKDKPMDPAHTEEAWKKNRRGEFILLSPPGAM
jgi:peptidoglycan-associated lipoprotein